MLLALKMEQGDQVPVNAGSITPGASRKEGGPVDPFQTSDLQRKNCIGLIYRVCAHLLQQPWETNNPVNIYFYLHKNQILCVFFTNSTLLPNFSQACAFPSIRFINSWRQKL